MMPPVKEPLAGLALLVIFGFLIWHNRPLERAGPFYADVEHQNPNTTGHAYESRFWEDPFAFDPADPKEEKSEGYCKKQLIEEIKATENPVKILAPLLKVRPDTLENRELRTRHRYAVIAGLIESGYRPLKPGYRPLAPGHRPLEPGHLHFCSSQENSSNQEYDVRWEHYSRESQDESDKGKSDIIVVWMNSEIFVDSNRFRVMSENLLGSEKITKNSFYIYDLNNILDQNRSRNITNEINDINKNNQNENIKLVKPVGSDEALTKTLAEELKLRNIKEPSEEVTIITEYDSENARNLARDFRKSLSESFDKCKPESSTKTPIHNAENRTDNAESDTCEIRNVFYLKGLDAYQQRIHKQDKNENQAADKQADRRSVINLHNLSPLPIGASQSDYFHRLAGKIKDPHNNIDIEKRDSGIKAVGIFGSDFHDKLLILEALRREMPNILVFTTDLDTQMLYPQHWRLARNMVVASHFNLLLKDKDKEQYRKQCKDEGKYEQFPALLDYCSAVASVSAGAERYQERFPAFRDSQQTNIFFRTLGIVTDDVEKSVITSPQIFEIGRNGFVRLAQEKNEDLNYHPSDNTLEQATTRLLLLAGIIVTLICFQWAIRPIRANSGNLTRFLLLSTLAIFAIAVFFATDELGEPLSFTDGTSLWPSIFIQIIAILLAGAFFYRARRDLDENFCCLSRRYFPISLSKQVFPDCLDECGWKLNKFGSSSRLPCIILIFSFAFYAVNDVYPSELRLITCFVLLVLLALFYLTKIEERDFVSIKGWIEKDNCQPGKINREKNSCRIRNALCKLWIFSRSKDGSENYEDRLWQEYYKYGLIDHRASRVVAIWLYFAIIETILVYLLPPWPLPCRGEAACLWASSTGVTGFTVVMLLLFFILDAVRLSFYWIKKLRTQHPLLIDRVTEKHEADFEVAAINNPLPSLEKIVDAVAERTRVVDKLIYYAMLCIMLMLFARITYFDNQEFPLSKGITFAVSISLLFFSGFILRSEAEQLKLAVIKNAENLGKNNKCNQEKVDKAIERIKNINDGAFKPMLEQPVMQALLMILASIGLFAGEYLKLFG